MDLLTVVARKRTKLNVFGDIMRNKSRLFKPKSCVCCLHYLTMLNLESHKSASLMYFNTSSPCTLDIISPPISYQAPLAYAAAHPLYILAKYS